MMERAINPPAGALVCAARKDGVIVIDRPYAYNACKQGDSPVWLSMLEKARRQDGKDERREKRTWHR